MLRELETVQRLWDNLPQTVQDRDDLESSNPALFKVLKKNGAQWKDHWNDRYGKDHPDHDGGLAPGIAGPNPGLTYFQRLELRAINENWLDGKAVINPVKWARGDSTRVLPGHLKVRHVPKPGAERQYSVDPKQLPKALQNYSLHGLSKAAADPKGSRQ